jgi:hypothetical protein
MVCFHAEKTVESRRTSVKTPMGWDMMHLRIAVGPGPLFEPTLVSVGAAHT